MFRIFLKKKGEKLLAALLTIGSKKGNGQQMNERLEVANEIHSTRMRKREREGQRDTEKKGKKLYINIKMLIAIICW